MGQTDVQAFGVALGARVREWREASGKRQGDVARAARRYYGLNWTQGTVAATELGQRQLRLEEFLLLPFILNTAEIHADKGGEERILELADLLPPTGEVTIFPGRLVKATYLWMMVQGKFGEIADIEKDPSPEVLAAQRKMQRTALLHSITQDIERMNAIRHISPKAEKNLTLLTKVVQEARDEVEMQAARKCGVPPVAIALAARRLWGHSLTIERDRLVASQIAEDTQPRRVQALRGHITRSLLTQLEPLIASLRSSS